MGLGTGKGAINIYLFYLFIFLQRRTLHNYTSSCCLHPTRSQRKAVSDKHWNWAPGTVCVHCRASNTFTPLPSPAPLFAVKTPASLMQLSGRTHTATWTPLLTVRVPVRVFPSPRWEYQIIKDMLTKKGKHSCLSLQQKGNCSFVC